jgi:hypothetical protein
MKIHPHCTITDSDALFDLLDIDMKLVLSCLPHVSGTRLIQQVFNCLTYALRVLIREKLHPGFIKLNTDVQIQTRGVLMRDLRTLRTYFEEEDELLHPYFINKYCGDTELTILSLGTESVCHVGVWGCLYESVYVCIHV